MAKIERSAGVILHPTSLPGPGGVGTLGAMARRFVDRLAQAQLTWWQILPLNPPGPGGSPYSATSAFAGNPILIDLNPLVERQWLSEEDSREFQQWSEKFPPQTFAVDEVTARKMALLNKAARTWREKSGEEDAGYQAFCAKYDARWLDDFALFTVLKDANEGAPWTRWKPALVRREEAALRQVRGALSAQIEAVKFQQWLFFEQWAELRSYAARKGVKFLGDLPIFVAMDSADVWAERRFFELDEEGKPEAVAGVPPDYFSATGQRWGNPLYDWAALEKDGFQWWIQRVEQALKTVDLIRIDHFRGFESYWRIPAEEPTAVVGRWVKGPGDKFFNALSKALGRVPFVAEDLGIITKEVEELRDRQGLPGMKVMHFAFAGEADHPFLPHTYPENCVAYTGTHDNDTTRGWYESLDEGARHPVRVYLSSSDEEVVKKMIQRLWRSKAALTIILAQDLFELGSEARMNVPGQAQGNWSWRMTMEELEDEASFQWLGRLTRDSRRSS